MESDTVVCIDDKVRGVNVIAFQDHFKHFWLVHCAFLHEVDDLILDRNRMIHVVVQLNLSFVFKLSSFIQEFFVFNWEGKVFTILSDQIKFTDVSP